MPNRNTRNRSDMTQAEMVAAYLDDRDDDLLDAVVTAAALVACADGRSEPVEGSQLVDFLDRERLLPAFSRAEMLDAFDRRIRQLAEGSGTEAAVDSLGRLAGRSAARIVVDAGERVAAADGHLHPRELEVLRLIRIALGARSGLAAHRSAAGEPA